ncbi:hypothetical protein DLAC_10296 [Tieghemostelium lacteum]|uniref:Uncharacterized protein n=1 Tax=Tieghemostelium lacteum TaxID=361077 RepID=A0A151Z556_TIELA|nr:hypothetical protein DLAC_10296 [Tieghemostelium lacteum]|eukprot:KYQ89068.1 hypothetical protein DLAC_10296 [Tieghemostelium lacteum]
MKNILIVVMLCVLVESSLGFDYAYFYPPSQWDSSAVGYIVGVNQSCANYDAQGWSAIAQVDAEGSIQLQLYDNINCTGTAQYNEVLNGTNDDIYQIPFNHNDPNNQFMVSTQEPYSIPNVVMVMQFFLLSQEPQCLGQPNVLKFFFNGTFFNTSDPTVQVFCTDDNTPMTQACKDPTTCQNMPYPTGCNQLMPTIMGSFVCRTSGNPTSSSDSDSSNSSGSWSSTGSFSGSSYSGASSGTGSSQTSSMRWTF